MFRSPLECLGHQRSSREPSGTRGVDHGLDSCPGGRVEPRSELALLTPGQGRRARQTHEAEQLRPYANGGHDARVPTMMTELGCPKFSLAARGAAGSGRHSRPSTTKAYSW